ncbi:MAG: hypothetical protein JXR78_11670, partial [Victivallales bacterium]|nr:hypothetical protein [Victivallales bacterium]
MKDFNSMKKLFFSGLAVLSWSCFAGDMAEYALPSLNPVKFEQVKGAESLTLDSRMVIVIPEKSRDHTIPHVMYCGKGNVPYDVNTRAAELAASELSGFIEKSTGVKIPVISEAEAIPESSIPIFVGMSKAAEKYGLNNQGIRPEGFRVINTGKAIGIIGAERGSMSPSDGAAATLFGVYDFLERFAGVRFYYPDEGVIVQKRDKIVVPPVKYDDYPRFDHRYAHSWTWREFPGNCAPISAM